MVIQVWRRGPWRKLQVLDLDQGKSRKNFPQVLVLAKDISFPRNESSGYICRNHPYPPPAPRLKSQMVCPLVHPTEPWESVWSKVEPTVRERWKRKSRARLGRRKGLVVIPPFSTSCYWSTYQIKETCLSVWINRSIGDCRIEFSCQVVTPPYVWYWRQVVALLPGGCILNSGNSTKVKVDTVTSINAIATFSIISKWRKL